MTTYATKMAAHLRTARGGGLSIDPARLDAIRQYVPLADLSQTLGREILRIFEKKQNNIVRVNEVTGKPAVPFYDVLAALGNPVPEYRCMICWNHLRNFLEQERSMFEVYGLNRRGYSTPYIDLDAVEELASDIDRYVFGYARKTLVTDAVEAFKAAHGCR